MIALLTLLSAAFSASMLEVTRGVVGRGVGEIVGSERAERLVEAEEWAAAALSWGALADVGGAHALDARLWEMICAHRAGLTEQATAAIVAAMEASEGDPRVLLAASWLLNEGGDHRRVYRLLEDFPSDSGDVWGARVLQLRALMMRGKTRRALRLRDALIASGSDDAWFWFELALEDIWLDRPEALSHLRRAVRADGAASLHHQLLAHQLGEAGAYPEALSVGITGVERFPDDPMMGLAVLQLAQTRAGRDALVAMAAADPERGSVHAMLGTVLMVEEEHARAAAHFQAAINSGENRPALFRLLAEAQVASDQGSTAWDTLSVGIERYPENPRLWSDLFSIGRDDDRLSDALVLSERSWRSGVQAPFLVRFSYSAATDLEDLELALRWSERGLSVEGVRLDAMSWRALSLARLGRGAEALKAYEEALRSAPEEASLLNNLAWFLLDPGDGLEADPLRAVALAEAAVESTHEQVPAYLDTLARALWDIGDRQHALQLQRKAAQLDPDNEYIRRTLQKYETAPL